MTHGKRLKWKENEGEKKNHDSVFASDGAISLHVISKFRRKREKTREKRDGDRRMYISTMQISTLLLFYIDHRLLTRTHALSSYQEIVFG